MKNRKTHQKNPLTRRFFSEISRPGGGVTTRRVRHGGPLPLEIVIKTE